VANLTPKQVDALATDTRLIRNRKTIEATGGER
jgi:3-methyladenine DNA glycosylase Tag